MIKNILKKQRIMLFFVVFAFLFCFNFISSVNLGVSPASIEFREVLRGGYSERGIVISVDSEDFVGVEIDPRGDIEGWLNFSAVSFNVSKNNPYYLTISIVPPVDMPNGNYSGFVRIKTSALGTGVEDHAVGVVRSTLDLTVRVQITDVEIRDCVVSSIDVVSAEQGEDVVFNAKILNNGNVRLNPSISIDVWDPEQTFIVQSENFIGESVLPTRVGNFSVEVSSKNLEINQYWADFFAVDCYHSQALTFDVLEKGALSASGVLSEIMTMESIEVKETAPIVVKFENTGEKSVDAQFKGKITRGGKIIQILESEKTLVPVSSFNDFTFYFTPEKAGKYIISGRVFFSGKKTFESSTVLNVGGSNFSWSILLIQGLAFGLFLFLIYKVRIERQRHASKIRRLKHG